MGDGSWTCGIGCGTVKRLLLCAGGHRKEGFATLDGSVEFGPDYVRVLPCVLPDAPWDEIWLIHGIEHFYRWEASAVLSECWRALKPGGRLVLEQPNLEMAARALLGLCEKWTPEQADSDMRAIYGHPEYRSAAMVHKWGWTPESLREALEDVGDGAWAEIRKAPVETHVPIRDFRLEAVKA
jgi:predicted SAM-dependent methyltransferase